MRVEEGDERYLSMDVLKSIDLFKLSKVQSLAHPSKHPHLLVPLARAKAPLFCLMQGQEVPDYHRILAPNDIFGLGASL